MPISYDGSDASAGYVSVTGRRQERLRVIVATLPVLLALVYAFVQGSFADGAKDIDTRYFFVAGKTWLSGHSPYDFGQYERLWRQYFADPVAPGAFAYLPGSILYSAPLGLCDWSQARLLFRSFNFIALLLIVWLCVAFIRRIAGKVTLVHCAWIALGIVLGGVPGTLLTGQSTVLVCAAALAVAIPQRRSPYLFFLAVLAASSKPQATAPILLIAVVSHRPARRRIGLAGLAAAAASALVLFIDPEPISNLLGALTGNASLGANQADHMIGLGPLLATIGVGRTPSRLLQWLALVAVVVMVGRASQSKSQHEHLGPLTVMAGFISMGLAYPFHSYDTAMFAPACAMAALLSARRQLFLLPAFVLLGRPGLLELAAKVAKVTPSIVNPAAGLLWLYLVTVVVVWTCKREPVTVSGEASA